MVVESPQIPDPLAAGARAQWLAELADALDAAQAMVARLRGLSVPTAMELHVRIEAARLEVRALRLRARRLPGGKIDPERTSQPPWERIGTGF